MRCGMLRLHLPPINHLALRYLSAHRHLALRLSIHHHALRGLDIQYLGLLLDIYDLWLVFCAAERCSINARGF